MRVLLVVMVVALMVTVVVITVTMRAMFLRTGTSETRSRRRAHQYQRAWDTQPWQAYMRIETGGYWHIGVERVTDVGEMRTVLNTMQMYECEPGSSELERQILLWQARDTAARYTEDGVRSYKQEITEEDVG